MARMEMGYMYNTDKFENAMAFPCRKELTRKVLVTNDGEDEWISYEQITNSLDSAISWVNLIHIPVVEESVKMEPIYRKTQVTQDD